jgi:hypothetical protein
MRKGTTARRRSRQNDEAPRRARESISPEDAASDEG